MLFANFLAAFFGKSINRKAFTCILQRFSLYLIKYVASFAWFEGLFKAFPY